MEFLESKENIASFQATIIVSAKQLAGFILDKFKLHQIPRKIQYYLVLIWNSYAQVYKPDRIINGRLDQDFQDYFESGGLDERFAMIVKQLYELCKEEKLL